MSKATIYYVSNGGNDSNSGLTTALPWKTLDKVNATTTFKAGDQILFERGSTFYGSLTINQSGASGNPITFGAYGTGTDPIITLQPYTSVVLMKDSNPASGLPVISSTQTFDVYPNPSQGKFTVRFAILPPAESRIEVIDLAGRKVVSRPITACSEEINLSGIADGVYLIKSILGAKEHIQKLLVHN